MDWLGYLDAIRPLRLILHKMNGYVKTFKEKSNKLTSVCVADDKQLEKYKTIWTKIELKCFTNLRW